MFIDVVFAGVLAYGIYVGYTNGIVKTIFTVLSIALGVLVTGHFHATVTRLIKEVSGYDHPIMTIVGMLVTFLFTMIFLRLIGKQIENVLKSINVNFLNQIMGAVVMSGLMAVVYSIIINFGVQARVIAKPQAEESISYPILQQIPERAGAVYAQFSPKVKELWEEIAIAFDNMSESSSEYHIRDEDLPKDSPNNPFGN